MKWTILAASVIAALTAFTTEPVLANDVADVVRARANARAGGGTSGHDAWVLKRHGRLTGTRTRRASSSKASQRRARLVAKKKKAAAAKKRAYLLAKKKKAAKKRALLAAKKKAAQIAARKAAEKRRLAAQKAAAEKKRKLAARQAEQQKLAALEADKPEQVNAQRNAKADKSESTYIAAPSTTAIMTSYELTPADRRDERPLSTKPVAAIVDGNAQVSDVVEDVSSTLGRTKTANSEGCKRFLPAIGLTVSVGCE